MSTIAHFFFIGFAGVFLFSVPHVFAAAVPVGSDTADFEKVFYYSERRGGVDALRENINKINIFAPQVYVLDAKLRVSGGLENLDVRAIVAKHNVRVMPLVANDRFRQAIMTSFLASSTAQDAAIRFFIDEANKKGYIGWQFDFEHMRAVDRDRYTAFVKKTHEAFQYNNLILSLAVVARNNDVVNDFYKNWSGVFDYPALARASDFLSVMTYDDPYSVGPVASIPYVTSILEYLHNKVPSHKISMGIPLYYWGWRVSPPQKVRFDGTYNRLQMIRATYPYQEGFDAMLGAPWLTYSWNTRQYKVWFENQESFNLKLGLISQYGLRGFSAWVLGMEDPSIWFSLAPRVDGVAER